MPTKTKKERSHSKKERWSAVSSDAEKSRRIHSLNLANVCGMLLCRVCGGGLCAVKEAMKDCIRPVPWGHWRRKAYYGKFNNVSIE